MSVGTTHAQPVDDPNACDAPGDSPDVLVGDIPEVLRHGSTERITAFSIGTVACNVGSCWLNWEVSTPQHPVIGQNLFRLKDGRFEQIGQSWVKHAFFALSQPLCSGDCIGTDGAHLGVNCSDPYSAKFNGQQQRLGPKSEVNPATGAFPYPFAYIDQTGPPTYKRLQVPNEDLEPSRNVGALYFVEAQYVAADDAAAGNDDNNSSYRRVTVVQSDGLLDLVTTDETVRGTPAIAAWEDQQPTVVQQVIDIPADGRLVCAADAIPLGDGRYRYEYAVQNLNSHRAVRTVRVPIPVGAQLTGAGFHDVFYHSGEPFDATDWGIEIHEPDDGSPHAIVWSAQSYEQNVDANALRWGTLYNFRFEVDAPPRSGPLTFGLFGPGIPDAAICDTLVPEICDGDRQCEPGETCRNCASDCLDSAGPDEDGDTFAACDCDDGNGLVWNDPSAVRDLTLDRGEGSVTWLGWTAPARPGGDAVVYDVLRSSDAADFLGAASCLVSDNPATLIAESESPAVGRGFYYLVRTENDCPAGSGSIGSISTVRPRIARECP